MKNDKKYAIYWHSESELVTGTIDQIIERLHEELRIPIGIEINFSMKEVDTNEFVDPDDFFELKIIKTTRT